MIVELNAAQVPIAGVQLLTVNAMVRQAKHTGQFYRPKLRRAHRHRRAKSTPNTVMRIGCRSLLQPPTHYLSRDVYSRADRASGRFTFFFSRL